MIQSDRASSSRVFAVVLAAGFLALLGVSIINVALPSIESELSATASQIQWIIVGYTLSFGLVLVAAGKAGDVFGRRALFMLGVGGFVLASLGCGLAPTATWLVALRYLIEEGIYESVEQSFVNWALEFAIWNLETLEGEACELLKNKLREIYFDDLGISKHPAEYFYNSFLYERYKEIIMI